MPYKTQTKKITLFFFTSYLLSRCHKYRVKKSEVYDITLPKVLKVVLPLKN